MRLDCTVSEKKIMLTLARCANFSDDPESKLVAALSGRENDRG